MNKSLLSQLNAALAHPKPRLRHERTAKQGVRRRSRLDFREAVMRADRNTCAWCEKRGMNLHACHIENKRPHARELDTVENGIALCFICHYWFDEGGKVNSHVRTADEFRLMVFEKHEHEKTFRHAPHLKRLRAKLGKDSHVTED